MKRYLHAYSLTLADIDPENRMTASAVLCYFQDAIARFLAQGRVGAFDLMENGITWMIAEFHSSLDTMPAWPGTARVEVFISELSRVKVYVDYLMRDDQGRIFARGSSIWLMVDVKSRRMLPCNSVPQFLLLYDERNFVPHARYDFRPLCEEREALRTSHTVGAAETDFNGHMSNRDYVKFALQVISPLAGAERVLREVHVKFKQECHRGETLQCTCCRNSDEEIAVALSRADGTTVCQIATIWK